MYACMHAFIHMVSQHVTWCLSVCMYAFMHACIYTHVSVLRVSQHVTWCLYVCMYAFIYVCLLCVPQHVAQYTHECMVQPYTHHVETPSMNDLSPTIHTVGTSGSRPSGHPGSGSGQPYPKPSPSPPGNRKASFSLRRHSSGLSCISGVSMGGQTGVVFAERPSVEQVDEQFGYLEAALKHADARRKTVSVLLYVCVCVCVCACMFMCPFSASG